MINLLSSTAYLIVNKKLSREVGLEASALLADLISKQVYFENEQGCTDYFFNTIENIEKDTTLSVYKQRAAISKLKSLGLISVKRKGIPAKRYFKVNAEQVMQFLHNKKCNKPITTNNNKVINNNNNNTILNRKSNFVSEVLNLCYAEKLLDDNEAEKFIGYWCEPNKSKTKMRWEMQRTWDLNLRLKNWQRRNKAWASNTKGNKLEQQIDEYNKGKKYL